MRRVLIPIVLLALAGCSPVDRTGVTVDERDVPVVINCGSSIFGVEVADADTGRVVWAASASELENGGKATQSRVVLGDLPSPSWRGDSPLDPEPIPSTWRFRVDTTNDVVIDVGDGDLERGVVHRPDSASESSAHFDEQTCSGLPFSPSGIRVVFGLVVVAGLLAVAVTILRLRRKRAEVVRA
jgi:hypothetical protein